MKDLITKFVVGSAVGALVYVPCTLYFSWVNGFVASKIWTWLIIPQFHWPMVTWQAFSGMFLLWSLYRSVIAFVSKEKGETDYTKVMIGMITPWALLVSAWLISN